MLPDTVTFLSSVVTVHFPIFAFGLESRIPANSKSEEICSFPGEGSCVNEAGRLLTLASVTCARIPRARLRFST